MWLKWVAVGLLATGLAAAFVGELFTEGPAWLLLIVGGIFAAVSAICWKWPRAGGVLLVLASALMFFVSVALVEYGHSWEEGEASWAASEKLLVAFLGGVPLIGGVLFLLAGWRADRTSVGRDDRRGRRGKRVLLPAAALGAALVAVAWAFPLNQHGSGVADGISAEALQRFVAEPVWSPDGRFVAYADCRSTDEGETSDCDIAIIRRDGSGTKKLTEGAAYDRFPVWGPGGRTIAFVRDEDVYDGDVYEDVYVVNVDGSNLRNLTRTPAKTEHSPAWSPDGRLIAFVREGVYGLGDIVVMTPNGGGQRSLTRSASEGLGNPVWSPDGRTIAYEGGTGSYEILTVAREGGAVTDLTHRRYADLSPEWSPDGRRIAFVSTRAGFGDVFVMNTDGTEPRNLTNFRHSATAYDPVWSPDGDTIAFLEERESGSARDIGVINADGTARSRTLTNTPLIDESNVRWSPDGRTILYATSNWDTGVDALFAMNADGTRKRGLIPRPSSE